MASFSKNENAKSFNMGETMSEITKITNEIVIYDDVLDAHHGQMDGIIRIGNSTTNKVYGYVEYSIYRDGFHVNMIEVYKEYQRQGYATELIKYIKSHYKRYKLDIGYTTGEGDKLIRSLKGGKKK